MSFGVRRCSRSRSSGVSITPSFALWTIIFAFLPAMTSEAFGPSAAYANGIAPGTRIRPVAPAAPAIFRKVRRSKFPMALPPFVTEAAPARSLPCKLRLPSQGQVRPARRQSPMSRFRRPSAMLHQSLRRRNFGAATAAVMASLGPSSATRWSRCATIVWKAMHDAVITVTCPAQGRSSRPQCDLPEVEAATGGSDKLGRARGPDHAGEPDRLE